MRNNTAVTALTTVLVSLGGVVIAMPAQAATGTAQACFDRLVVDLGPGRKPGYRVRYVRAFYASGSGMVVHVRGHAKLLVTVLAPAASNFPASSRHLVRVAGFPEFRQVAGLGSFEGITSIGIGLRARKPFRVLELTSSGHRVRLIVDVAR
jgi:hypothetical protein